MSENLKEELIRQIEKLDPAMQRRLLDYSKTLPIRGVDGRTLLRFEGAISPEDLELMSQAIEEGCEKVDPGEW